MITIIKRFQMHQIILLHVWHSILMSLCIIFRSPGTKSNCRMSINSRKHAVFKFREFLHDKKNNNHAWLCNSRTNQQNILSLYEEQHNVLLTQGIVLYFFLEIHARNFAWVALKFCILNTYVLIFFAQLCPSKEIHTQIFCHEWGEKVSNDLCKQTVFSPIL